jgi:hypothetical protein
VIGADGKSETYPVTPFDLAPPAPVESAVSERGEGTGLKPWNPSFTEGKEGKQAYITMASVSITNATTIANP